MDGQSCNEHGCDSVSRNTQSHHRNQGSTERSVVCCLTGPDTGRISFTEGLRFLADALGITIGYHVGDTGSHTRKEADPETYEEGEEDCLDVGEDILEAYSKALHVLYRTLRHLCASLCVVTDDLAHSEHTKHLCNCGDSTVEIVVPEGETGHTVDWV